MRIICLVAMIMAIAPLGRVPVIAAEPAAARLRLVGTAGLVRTGDIIPIQLQIDSAGQKINAVEVGLRYRPDQLRATSVTREQSVMTLWPEQPNWETPGIVRLVAGRPGGLYAVNAAVATLYFRVLRAGEVDLSLEPAMTAAYLHDGQGTRLPLAMERVTVNVSSDLVPGLALVSTTHPTAESWSRGRTAHIGWTVESGTEYSYVFNQDPFALPDETPETTVGSVEFSGLEDGIYYFTIKQRARGSFWTPVIQRRFLIDRTSPDPFTIEQLAADAIGGQQAIAWQTNDSMSGVAEARAQVGRQSIGVVESPLRLAKPWRGKKIVITVIDSAGNTVSASWQYGRVSLWGSSWALAVAAAVVLGGAGAVTWLARRRRRLM